jgi:hypothetical protein
MGSAWNKGYTNPISNSKLRPDERILVLLKPSATSTGAFFQNSPKVFQKIGR